jgi:tetratricopeptide (TPR) repeat protein
LNVSVDRLPSSHQSEVRCSGWLDTLSEEPRLGGEAKLAWEKALAVAGTALMTIRTPSMLIAESLGLERYRQQVVHDARPKAGRLASAANEAFASPEVAAWALSNLAIVYNAQGRTKDAIALLERALAVAGNGPQANHYRVGVIKNRLALYLYEDGRSADAEIQFKQAISAFERSGDRAPAAGVLHNLAQSYARQRRHSEAVETALS